MKRGEALDKIERIGYEGLPKSLLPCGAAYAKHTWLLITARECTGVLFHVWPNHLPDPTWLVVIA